MHSFLLFFIYYLSRLNLDLTVAVTQNFAELRNLPIVRRSVFRTLWIGDLLHESDKWLAAVSEKWPGLVDPTHCVECGMATDTVLPLLSNRRLCSGCEQVGPAYALFSAADATKCYKLGLDKLMTLPHVVKPAAGEDNAPPVPYFLQQHVLELAEAVYGKDTESSGQYVDQRSFGGSALIVLKAWFVESQDKTKTPTLTLGIRTRRHTCSDGTLPT